jgi:hypothetical protein
MNIYRKAPAKLVEAGTIEELREVVVSFGTRRCSGITRIP